jgi:hypothetical protein
MSSRRLELPDMPRVVNLGSNNKRCEINNLLARKYLVRSESLGWWSWILD